MVDLNYPSILNICASIAKLNNLVREVIRSYKKIAVTNKK